MQKTPLQSRDMKNSTSRLFLFVLALAASLTAAAQQDWPRLLTAPDGTRIKVYEPQAESLAGGELKFRSVISVQDQDQDEPVFGTQWSVANVAVDEAAHKISLNSVKVPNLKLASDTDNARVNYLKAVLEAQLPDAMATLDLDQVNLSIARNGEEKKQATKFNNQAPEIIYADRPSTLVIIDGEPKWKRNDDWGMEAVVNSPFTIVRNGEGQVFLYGGKKWYSGPSAKGPYRTISETPSGLAKVQEAVDALDNADPGYASHAESPGGDREIIVRTHPAELVQTRGGANLSPIEGTDLSYVSNSDNDIFLNAGDQQYYLLLSGRWFKSKSLQSGWQYLPSSSLPADFARIPNGSPKDNVLASVAGTEAARDAVMDAQVPQTAKVDRNNANADVTYDGDPRFQDIPGTHLQYATNSASSVIRYRDRYYVVDNGVWFESYSANGPWTVATQRPAEVDIIPPSNPMYNLKYVYIYDVTPGYVYMGYTPGYLNTFIYGPTVVYGTGFHYNPWWGNFYYPRPYTWGFSFHYNPWFGWSMGFGYSYGWFNIGWGSSCWGGWSGGWWGPRMYHPPYHCYSGYGYYGNGNYNRRYAGYGHSLNRNYTGNMYGYRRDSWSYDNRNQFERRYGYDGGRNNYAAGFGRGNEYNGRNGGYGTGDRNGRGNGNRGGAFNGGTRGYGGNPNGIIYDRNGNMDRRGGLASGQGRSNNLPAIGSGNDFGNRPSSGGRAQGAGNGAPSYGNPQPRQQQSFDQPGGRPQYQQPRGEPSFGDPRNQQRSEPSFSRPQQGIGNSGGNAPSRPQQRFGGGGNAPSRSFSGGGGGNRSSGGGGGTRSSSGGGGRGGRRGN
jgi:hypothetical protein